jgi:hypothetical protein
LPTFVINCAPGTVNRKVPNRAACADAPRVGDVGHASNLLVV